MQKLEPIFGFRSLSQRNAHFLRKNRFRFGGVSFLHMLADIRSGSQKLFTQHKFAFFFAEVLIKFDNPQSKRKGFIQNNILCHKKPAFYILPFTFYIYCKLKIYSLQFNVKGKM